VRVTFVSPDGTETECHGTLGQDLMRLAHANDVDLEGACEGACACSTCHVILDPEVYERLPAPGVEEEDMLDLAFGVTMTSRLGCQVRLRRDLEGMRVRLPAATRNMAVDGFKPKPH
jgi:ferredoxin